jgi:hypothetical protein
LATGWTIWGLNSGVDNKLFFIVWVIKSRIMRWVGHIARREEERGVYRVLVGKPEGNRPLGRPRNRWEDNIEMDLQEVGCGVWTG